MRLFKGHIQAFQEVIGVLRRHRELTLEMARREISDRYVGQAFGMVWAVGHPIFMMGLYVFIFAFVFKTKVGGTIEMPLDYTTYLLSGLVAWMGFQESMAKSCTAITSNASLVKQVVFPLEILPVKGVISSLFQQSILILLLIIYVLLSHGRLPWTYLLLPVLVIFQLFAMIGVSYLLSAVGTYFRDMKDFVQLFAVSGVYLLPVFYLPAWVPPLFKPLLYLNPFSYLIWCYQDALYFGRIEHPWAWVVNGVASLSILVIGYRLFRKLKPSFGNVL
jgi:lipopolysaccharide transport system permease protein